LWFIQTKPGGVPLTTVYVVARGFFIGDGVLVNVIFLPPAVPVSIGAKDFGELPTG
jgi:hypothetical protein